MDSNTIEYHRKFIERIDDNIAELNRERALHEAAIERIKKEGDQDVSLGRGMAVGAGL